MPTQTNGPVSSGLEGREWLSGTLEAIAVAGSTTWNLVCATSPKLLLWALKQFDEIMLLDADTLVLSNPDRWFSLLEGRQEALLGGVEFAKKGDVERIKLLLAAGCPPSFADYDSRTGLHLACSEGNLQVVKLLVEELGAAPQPLLLLHRGHVPHL